MYKKSSGHYFLFLLISLITILASSCSSSRNLGYFQDLPSSTVVPLPPIQMEDRVIENGDNLYISISGRDKEAASFFNKTQSGVPATSGVGVDKAGAGMNSSASGALGADYLVDSKGIIEFPILGKVSVVGLSAHQLKETLTRLVSTYLKEPLVEVRFLTFRVSLIGEVRNPGAFVLPMQRTSILDALAAGGDLPITAKRYDVLLYRDYKGQRTITRVDLRSKDVLTNKDVFQIRHNDVIYVQPRKGAVIREEATLFTSIASIAIAIVTLGLAISK